MDTCVHSNGFRRRLPRSETTNETLPRNPGVCLKAAIAVGVVAHVRADGTRRLVGNDAEGRVPTCLQTRVQRIRQRRAATHWVSRFAVVLGLSLVTIGSVDAWVLPRAVDGRVRFYYIALVGDPYVDQPSLSDQDWMRAHYTRMLSFSPYFDSRLSWYPNAWAYKAPHSGV